MIHVYERKITMRKDRNKKQVSGKALAISAVIGVAAVCAATLAAYNQTINRLTPTNANPETTSNTWVFTTSATQNEAPAEPTEPTEIPNEESAAEVLVPETAEAQEVNKPIASTARNIMPVEGEISHPFSNGELVKSETLGVWKTHDGCDIDCELGTEVRSMSDGVVTEITEDPLWGICVVTEQGNGLEVHYCGLAKELQVKVGQELAEGAVIGVTSDTCQVEIVQEPHLHLGVKQGGKWIDPMSVIDTADISE